MGEGKVVNRNVAIMLGTLCTILAVSLMGAIMSYMSIIREKDDAINSLSSQVLSLQDQITNLQNRVTDLQNEVNVLHDIFNLSGPETLRISWFDVGSTSNGTKLGIGATVVNNGSILAENVSLIIDVLFYNFIPHDEEFERVESSTYLTIEIGRLEIGDYCTLQSSIDMPEGEGWRFWVDFTLYANGVEIDHTDFGCF